MTKIKYVLINELGKEEPWTDPFETEKAADDWYETHGKEWESKGKIIKRVVYKNKWQGYV